MSNATYTSGLYPASVVDAERIVDAAATRVRIAAAACVATLSDEAYAAAEAEYERWERVLGKAERKLGKALRAAERD